MKETRPRRWWLLPQLCPHCGAEFGKHGAFLKHVAVRPAGLRACGSNMRREKKQQRAVPAIKPKRAPAELDVTSKDSPERRKIEPVRTNRQVRKHTRVII